MKGRLALAVALVLVAGACGESAPGEIRAGSALRPTVGRNRWVLGAVPPGHEFIMLSAFLWNTSSEPISLSRVSLTGTYLGRLKVVRMEMAPLPGTHARPRPYQRSLGVVPGGVYTTYPPAFRERGDPCHVQELRPVSGYRLGPDRVARALVWLRAVSPGPFHVEGHRVVYDQGGSEYQQVLFMGVRGRVEEGASRRGDDPGEVACAREPGVRLLNGD